MVVEKIAGVEERVRFRLKGERELARMHEFVRDHGGEIVAVNEDLADDPEKINADPYGDGWIVRLQPSGDDGETMSPDEYQAFLDELED